MKRNAPRAILSPARLAVLFGALLSVSCGGGSKSSEQTTTSLTESAVKETAEVTVTLPTGSDEAPYVSQVQNVATPYGAASPGQKITVDRDGVNLIFAVDEHDAIVLASYEKDNAVLNADTTAFAFAKLALKLVDLPREADKLVVEKFIRKSTLYASTVAAIRSALKANPTASPIESADVADQVFLLVSDALKLAQESGQLTVSEAVTKGRAQAQSVPMLSSFPYYFWNESATDRAWLTDDPKAEFNNRTFLVWALQASNTTSTSTAVSALPLKSTLGELFAYYGGSETSTGIPTQGNQFILTVSQNSSTRLQNSQNVVTRATFTLIDVLLGSSGASSTTKEKCTIDVAKTLMDDQFSKVMADFSVSAVLDYAWNQKFKLPGAVISSCSKYVANLDKRLKEVKWISGVFSFYKALKIARSTVAAFGTFTQFAKYDKAQFEVELCKTSDRIEPCKDLPPPAWSYMTLPFSRRVSYGTDNTCDTTEEISVIGVATLAATSCTGSELYDLKTGYRLLMSPTQTYFKLFPPGGSTWFVPQPYIKTLSVTGSAFVSYIARRDEILRRLHLRSATCTLEGKEGTKTGLIDVRAEGVWLLPTTEAAFKLGELPASSDAFPLYEEYWPSVGYVTLTNRYGDKPYGETVTVTKGLYLGGDSLQWHTRDGVTDCKI